MYQNSTRGSEWRKWDLHIHTPASIVQYYGKNDEDTWNKFLKDLENLPKEFSVLGINDYLFIEGYKRILEEKRKGRLSKIDLIFPIVEFRIEKFAGIEFGKLKRMNLHIIFSNELKIETIQSQFLDGLSQSYKLEKDGIEWNRKIDRSSIEDLGRKVKGSVPPAELSKFKCDLEEGFNNLNFDENKIFELLKRDCFRNKFLIGIGKTEWEALKWSDSSIASKKSFINNTHVVFTAGESVEAVLRSTQKLKENNVNDILLDCSDAHYHSTSKEKDRIGNCYTWIKSEPNFEGLKQIIYDPQSRISIQEHKPVQPNNVIESMTFNIQDSAKISVKQNDGLYKNEKFCFAGFKNTYYLSPYFNCFIGGRGTGKSTILNFLGQYSNNPISSEEFWHKIKPSFDTKDVEYFSFEGVELFEFLGQNEVESFATNTEAFTNAIYERANLLNNEIFSSHEKKLSKLLDEVTSFKQVVEDINQLIIEKDAKEKEKKIIKKSIKVTESTKYKTTVDNIKENSQHKQLLEEWRTRTDILREDIGILFNKNFPTSSEKKESITDEQQKSSIAQEYQNAFEKVKEILDNAKRILAEKNFEKEKQNETDISQTISEEETGLSDLLKLAGLSEENILQIKSAPQKLIKINSDLLKNNEKLEENNAKLSNYQNKVTQIKKTKQDFENEIKKSIMPLIKILDDQRQRNNQENIKSIGLEYFFDYQLAWKEIADEAYSYFSKRYKTTEKSVHVKDYIINKKDSFSNNLEIIKNQLSCETQDTEYLRFLKSVFDDNSNYQIFETIRDKHLNDVRSYKRIQVLYDGKDIEYASFGQKCTAVMVILLLFGNYPLIIDEPEAHLDSSLIANYLVPLIKEKKKNRQIIFATHNANFVINGDAEKIFILKNETGKTDIIETTIENLNNRDELLKLEGGKEAFRKRGEKLHI